MSQNQNQSQEPQIFALVKQEMPTIEALIALNIGPGDNVKTIAIQELEYLKMQADLKPALYECTPYSVLHCVKSVIKKNLTLDPSVGLVYIQTRSVNMNSGKKDGQGVALPANWIKVLEMKETANGLISVNRQCGRILDHKRPSVQKNSAGKVIGVTFEYLVPSQPTPRWEVVSFDESDFTKWRFASHKENRKAWDNSKPQYRKQEWAEPDDQLMNWANPNYISFNGGIDPEFARAKSIRHALKKLGTNPNEGRAKVIVVEKKDVQVVETKADIESTHDEQSSFAQFEEVGSEINSPANQPQEEISELGVKFNFADDL